MADQTVTQRPDLETASEASIFQVVKDNFSYSHSKGNHVKKDRN